MYEWIHISFYQLSKCQCVQWKELGSLHTGYFEMMESQHESLQLHIWIKLLLEKTGLSLKLCIVLTRSSVSDIKGDFYMISMWTLLPSCKTHTIYFPYHMNTHLIAYSSVAWWVLYIVEIYKPYIQTYVSSYALHCTKRMTRKRRKWKRVRLDV